MAKKKKRVRKENLDFIDLGYKPKKDLVCLFSASTSRGKGMKRVANTIALESSVGTWTEVPGKDYVKKLRAKVFKIKGNQVYIAYPHQLFEKGNAPNILSSIAGNIFGMKAVKNLRLEDVSFPKEILKGFQGPRFGIKGIRKMMGIKQRPLIGTIIKPKLGLKTKDHVESAYQSWLGGCDIVKDDENLASQDFNTFKTRIRRTLQAARKAEKETGEKKAYLANVTAETNEMIERAKFVKQQGGRYVMIDIITTGWSALQTLREANLGLAIHAHRAMHAAMTRKKEHGINMMVIADFARLIGVDQIHIGTGVGKLEGEIKDIISLKEEISQSNINAEKNRLAQRWGKIKSVLPVSSGGLHPGHVDFLIKNLGKDIIIQMGGGIHGHPKGSFAGAKAARQAVDAVMQGKTLRQASRDKKNKELKEALQFWGTALYKKY